MAVLIIIGTLFSVMIIAMIIEPSIYIKFNWLISPTLRGEQYQQDWLCESNNMKIISYSNKFPNDIFSLSDFFIDNDKYDYVTEDNNQFIVRDDNDDSKIIDGHYDFNFNRLTLSVEHVYTQKYNKLYGNDYIFYIE